MIIPWNNYFFTHLKINLIQLMHIIRQTRVPRAILLDPIIWNILNMFPIPSNNNTLLYALLSPTNQSKILPNENFWKKEYLIVFASLPHDNTIITWCTQHPSK